MVSPEKQEIGGIIEGLRSSSWGGNQEAESSPPRELREGYEELLRLYGRRARRPFLLNIISPFYLEGSRRFPYPDGDGRVEHLRIEEVFEVGQRRVKVVVYSQPLSRGYSPHSRSLIYYEPSDLEHSDISVRIQGEEQGLWLFPYPTGLSMSKERVNLYLKLLQPLRERCEARMGESDRVEI